MEINQDYPPFSSCNDLEIKNRSQAFDISANTNEKMHKTPIKTLISPTLEIYHEELHKIISFRKPTLEELKDKFIFLGPKIHKYTLILDLDLTLVSCCVEKCLDNEHQRYYIKANIRPYALELIRELSSLYEIIIFTASEPDYANAIVNLLDPSRTAIKTVVSRRNCWEKVPGIFVKDLRIFADRNINDIIIADDSIYSFAFQISNGVPVQPYELNVENDGNVEKDEELKLLLKYLKGLYEENPEKIALANYRKLWYGLSLSP